MIFCLFLGLRLCPLSFVKQVFARIRASVGSTVSDGLGEPAALTGLLEELLEELACGIGEGGALLSWIR